MPQAKGCWSAGHAFGARTFAYMTSDLERTSVGQHHFTALTHPHDRTVPDRALAGLTSEPRPRCSPGRDGDAWGTRSLLLRVAIQSAQAMSPSAPTIMRPSPAA